MHFAVDRKHRDFFRKHHWLECEEVFSPEETKRIAEGVDAACAQRLKVKPDALAEIPSERLFGVGHDLWRADPTLKKVLLHHNLAEIAGELTEQKPLRFGYDMLLPPPKDALNAAGPYKALMEKSPTLAEISGIQGVVCGGVICVSGSLNQEGRQESGLSSLFSVTPGHIVFFSPDWPLPFSEILHRPDYQYLMFVYVKPKAVYFRQELDPHLHDFKQLGYQFGDKLTDALNPIVYS